MKKHTFYFSTIAPDADTTARTYGLGLEIAESCTAWNLDEKFPETDASVRQKLTGIENCILHAPFNELFPCAIDPKARELAAFRYHQAIAMADGYGATKVVVHGGYHPWIYFPEWYIEQSIVFWKDFLKEDPGIQIVLENVLEPEIQWLPDIVKGVDDPRLRLCLDVGHVNAYSKHSVMDWLESWAPWLSHFHIHNNDGSWDTHSGLDQGSIPMKALLLRAGELCPEATYTLEVSEATATAQWLTENGFLRKEQA